MRSTTKSKQDAHTETDLEGETKKPPALYLQKKPKKQKTKKEHPIVKKYGQPWKARLGSMTGCFLKEHVFLEIFKKQILFFKVKVHIGKFNYTLFKSFQWLTIPPQKQSIYYQHWIRGVSPPGPFSFSDPNFNTPCLAI